MRHALTRTLLAPLVLAAVTAATLVAQAAPSQAASVDGAGLLYSGIYSGDFFGARAEYESIGSWAGTKLTFSGTFHNINEDTGESNGPGDAGATGYKLESAWAAQSTPFANVEVNGTARDVASGKFDGEIARWARGVQKWLGNGGDRSVIIAPLQEMNGQWTQWGCDPGNYKVAYSKFRSAFAALGIGETQVRWAYAPNGYSDPKCGGARLRDYYPGPDIVDVIGFSSYNYGPKNYDGKYWGPDLVFKQWLDELRTFAPDKPYIVAQTGTAPTGGDRDTWLRSTWSYLKADPNVVGAIYFNINKASAGGNEFDWRVFYGGTNGAAGFRDGVASGTHQWPLTSWFQPGPLKLGQELPADLGGPVDRLSGSSRVATSTELSRFGFPKGSDTVLIATAASYPDALAGAPLAKSLGAPILLSDRDVLSDATRAEVERLGAKRAVLLGGPGALRPAVFDKLVAMGLETSRISGPSRFATAALIAEAVGGTAAYVVEGFNPDPRRGWPDAVSVSSLAAFQGRPILLATRDGLPAETAGVVARLGVKDATIVGGTAALGDAVVNQLESAGAKVERVSGSSRYDTSAKVAERAAAAGMDPARTWLATGDNWPDALAAAPVVAATKGVLLFVHSSSYEAAPSVDAWLRARSFESVRLIGGTRAISPDVEAFVRGAVR